MASTATYTCRCGNTFTARTADRKRGRALFCSKSCKAKEQESRTGQYQRHLARELIDGDAGLDGLEEGWDGHKNAF